MERTQNELLEFLQTLGMLGFIVHFVAQAQPFGRFLANNINAAFLLVQLCRALLSVSHGP